MIILDTNILSEVLKPNPSPVVMLWLSAQDRLRVFTTVITQAEVLYGIALLPPGKRHSQLSDAIHKIFAQEFESRLLDFDSAAARLFPDIVVGRQKIGRPISQFDAMIAAIAQAERATVATRNTNDFERCGIRIINPWNPAPK